MISADLSIAVGVFFVVLGGCQVDSRWMLPRLRRQMALPFCPFPQTYKKPPYLTALTGRCWMDRNYTEKRASDKIENQSSIWERNYYRMIKWREDCLLKWLEKSLFHSVAAHKQHWLLNVVTFLDGCQTEWCFYHQPQLYCDKSVYVVLE